MLLIILGAGASYDYHPQSSELIMPMANGLISDNLQNAGIAKGAWQGAIPIINSLQETEKMNPSNFNIEDALFKILERGDENINAQLLSFHFYVHNVISSAESNIRRQIYANTNYTALLAKLQNIKVDKEMGLRIISFNYDTLVEAACSQVYPIWNFNDYKDYLAGPNGVKLYKPHGSLNWQKVTGNIDYQSKQDSVIKLLSGRYSSYPAVERIVEYNEVYQTHTLGKTPLMQPILALPYKEKTDFVFPYDHKTSLINDMNEVTHVLTIGWRGSEPHFHQQILNRISSRTKVKILNVNKGNREVNSNLKATLGDRIESMNTFSKGFSNFLADDNVLKNFCQL